MLLFKRAALTDERKADCQFFSEHREDCKKTLDEARNKLTITHEYVARIGADMKQQAHTARRWRCRSVERDEFMNDVRRRRAKFQKELDDQSAQLEAENKLCTLLLERMNQNIKNLEDEVQNAEVEEQKIRQFNELIETETNLLMDEETKRAIWAQVEDVYSVLKPQEKNEDMMMTSKSEESALCKTEKTSLAQESQLRRSEANLIEQLARALIDSYKQMKAEHMKYPIDLGRSRVVGPSGKRSCYRAVKRLIENHNYNDRKACSEFAKRFKLEQEMREVRDVFEWLNSVIQVDIKRMKKWLDDSRKERKEFETLKAKGKEINWEQDTLERISALKEIQKTLGRKPQTTSSNRGGVFSAMEGLEKQDFMYP
ncbi:hypothetical protein PsorP6_014837 [Peronosclerospora sorghi]|uniref:Uncharacterized protein n=1 Tax=Peronosclerospora sorghi TaxID=230839 RepID=A0ACC0VSP5_9STRA|nr:hypothetical protein PsorP6_014837 [Peronosclerospora sorghi]